MGFREVGINRHIQPGRSAFDPAQHQMLHRIKANCAAFESTLYPGFNIRDLEDLQQSQNLNELTFALFTGRVASITGQARSTLTRENGQPTDSNLAQPSSVILLRARTPICASVF